jgi:hypothetical protein
MIELRFAALWCLSLSICSCKRAPTATAPASSQAEGEERAPDFKQAIAIADAIRGPQSGEARSKSCAALRALASHFNECNECQEPLIAITMANPGGDLGDCFLDELPKATARGEALCSALLASFQKSKYGTYEIGAIAQQETNCKASFDAVIAAESKRFAKFSDSYKDVSAAELLYLRRLADHMSPAQKQALARAAKILASRAKAKHARLQGQADKLSSFD